MTPNQIRDKALQVCADPEAARVAWDDVRTDPRCHGKVARAARLAMLTVIAEGGTIKAAKKAAREVLA